MIQLKLQDVQDLSVENPSLAERLEAEITDAQLALEAGNAEDALSKLGPLWEGLPIPKAGWDLYSGWISETIFRCYMSLARYEAAKEWALTHLDCRSSAHDTRPFVYVGMASLELGQQCAAYQYFDTAYRMGKRRAFQGEVPRYLEFYLMQKINNIDGHESILFHHWFADDTSAEAARQTD